MGNDFSGKPRFEKAGIDAAITDCSMIVVYDNHKKQSRKRASRLEMLFLIWEEVWFGKKLRGFSSVASRL
jgi:hypothetical protein